MANYLKINNYLDSDFQTGMSWRLLLPQKQVINNFRSAFSCIDKKTDSVGQESLQVRESPVCRSLVSRVKHFTAGILLAIPLLCVITILILRRFGNIFIVKTEALAVVKPQAPKVLPTPVAPEVVPHIHPAKLLISINPTGSAPADIFLCPERFDLMAKIIYGELRRKGVSSSWGEEIYAAHIQAWGNFTERPDPHAQGPERPKVCRDDFINTFNEILDTIEKDGFDKNLPGIPLGREDGIPVNGAHRLTACFVHGKPVKYFTSPLPQFERVWNWNYEYWSEACKLDEKYLDAMALKYCELKKNIFALAIFPCARKENLDKCTMELIKKYGGKIVYSKEISLNPTGGKNFVMTSYYRDPTSKWLGTPDNNYLGAQYNAEAKFPDREGSPPMQMVFFETDLGLEKIVELKKEIRRLYGMGNNSVHITDNSEQTLELAQTVLNPNTLHFLNNRNYGCMSNFEQYFERFKKGIADKGIDPNDICVDGGAVLAAYGLRDCNADLDFLYHGDDVPELGREFECNNGQRKLYGLNPDDIIYDPKNHFWYQGIKFASLDALKRLKEARNALHPSDKDTRDIQLIESRTTLALAVI